jgi:hypothetical protein
MIRLATRAAVRRLAILFLVLALLLLAGYLTMISMPGRSHTGPLPPLTEREAALAAELERYVRVLTVDIGERNVSFCPEALGRAAEFLAGELAAAGLQVGREEYVLEGVTCVNLFSEIRGASSPEEIVVVGGHYDSVPNCPGANDNATGAAATLALARAFARRRPARTLRFIAFVNEEPPYFQSGVMGSKVCARRSRKRGEDVVAMLSLETIGYYTDEEGTQRYPAPLSLFYPSKGNFVGFVGNFGSRKLVRRAVGSFRRHTEFPCEGGALPGWLPGVGWSDHWAYYTEGYPALMVTDTALFRYAHYHKPSDTIDKLDFEKTARVVLGVARVIEELVADD